MGKVRRMRRIILISLGVLVVLAAAWSAFWFHVASDVPARLAAWAATQRAHGLVAEYAGASVSGFPLSWQVTIDRPRMAGAGPTRWEWRGETAVAALRPWMMRDIPVAFPGIHRVAGGAGSVAETIVLRAGRPEGRIMLDADGRLEELALDLGDATLERHPAPEQVRARRIKFVLRPHRAPRGDHRTDVLDLALSAEDIALPAAPPNGLGATIALAQLDLSVKGKLPPGTLAQSVAAWRDDGGVIEAERIALRWGPLEIDGDGTFALDGENRPLAAFSARIRGYGDMIDTLAASGSVRPRDAAAVKVALNLLARETASGARELDVPITSQNGRLTVAGFPLAKVPPLRFE